MNYTVKRPLQQQYGGSVEHTSEWHRHKASTHFQKENVLSNWGESYHSVSNILYLCQLYE